MQLLYLYFRAYRGDALKYKYTIAQNQSFVQLSGGKFAYVLLQISSPTFLVVTYITSF